MNVIEQFEILDRALRYTLSDRSCVAHIRFAELCGRCYGTGSSDEARKVNQHDGLCEACQGTGRVNSQDGYAAWKALREAFGLETA